MTRLWGTDSRGKINVTLLANYIPFQDPQGGPNFYMFNPGALYEIHVDNNGDGRGDVNFDFRFQKHTKATNFAGIPTFLYNDGPITTLDDANWLVPQTYNVSRNGVRIGSNLPTPPANVGPRSTPNYEANLGAAAVKTLGNGMKVFAGQRDDPFFADT